MNPTTTRSVIGISAVAYISFALIGALSGGLVYIREVYGPTLLFPRDTTKGLSDLEEHCDPTTDDINDLMVGVNTTRREAREIAKTHGAAVLTEVLSPTTARDFRKYVMKANKELKASGGQVSVINSNHRVNLMPDINEPIVQEVLKEVGEHNHLKKLAEYLMGPGASLTNLSVLTAEYGAKQQHMHTDTDSKQFPEHFVPEYSLVIALQDTTETMGATHLCPGTHLCSSLRGETDDSDSDDDDDDDDDDDEPVCKVRATLGQGDAFIYKTDLYHRGGAHTDRKADERAFLFLIFAGSRQGPNDKRKLPIGMVRALDWKLWGHTIDDLATIKEKAWRSWHTFGLFNGKSGSSIRPWTVIDDFLSIFTEEGEDCHIISNDFDSAEFSKFVDKALAWALVAILVYLAIMPVLLLALVYHIVQSASKPGNPDGTIRKISTDGGNSRKTSKTRKIQ